LKANQILTPRIFTFNVGSVPKTTPSEIDAIENKFINQTRCLHQAAAELKSAPCKFWPLHLCAMVLVSLQVLISLMAPIVLVPCAMVPMG
jgi:hypothetical protein